MAFVSYHRHPVRSVPLYPTFDREEVLIWAWFVQLGRG